MGRLNPLATVAENVHVCVTGMQAHILAGCLHSSEVPRPSHAWGFSARSAEESRTLTVQRWHENGDEDPRNTSTRVVTNENRPESVLSTLSNSLEAHQTLYCAGLHVGRRPTCVDARTCVREKVGPSMRLCWTWTRTTWMLLWHQ